MEEEENRIRGNKRSGHVQYDPHTFPFTVMVLVPGCIMREGHVSCSPGVNRISSLPPSSAE